MKPVLNLFNYSHHMMDTELISLLGDKFLHGLPFQCQLSTNIEEADVVLWDGLITRGNKRVVDKILRLSQKGLFLLILGRNLFEDQDQFYLEDHPGINGLDLSGKELLPEEIIEVLVNHFEKLK